MRAFLAQVNARLPVAQPDETLLRLLQGERRRVCVAPCVDEPGQAAAACLAEVRDSGRPPPQPAGPAVGAMKAEGAASPASPDVAPPESGATLRADALQRPASAGAEAESAREPAQAHRAPVRHPVKS